MDHLQIELLYCQYGWSATQIAAALNKQESYVQLVIKEHAWTQGEKAASNEAAMLPTGPGQGGQALAIQTLKDREVHKQSMLAPLVAITEISLLSKLAEAIDRVDTAESDAHIKLANLVKSFKQFTQDSVTSNIVDDTNGKSGIAIQVITQIA